MKLARTSRPKEATFDLTPMIDVVMLLIVFFTMTSTFSRSEQKALDLPQERGAPVGPDDRHTIFLDVDRDGTITTLGEPVDLATLAATVRGRPNAAAGAGSGTGAADEGVGEDTMDIVVRADRACPSAHLNRIATELLKGGVKRWKLATAPDGSAGVPGAGGGTGGGGL